jgi:predicted transcriptional regulator
MSTAKEEVRQLLDRGCEAADQGRELTQDEVERRMARWLEP